MLRQAIPRFFTGFITKKEWKMIAPQHDWQQYFDDLNINQDTYRFSGTQEVINYVKEHQQAELYQKGIGSLLYNMGKDNIKDASVIKRIERELYKFKNEFHSRLSFGAYYGFLALSIDSLYMQEFLDAEFKRNVEDLDWKEALEIIEACGKNTSLTREYLFNVMKTICEPILIQQYNKTLKYSPESQLRLFNACLSAKYFEVDLFDQLVHDLIRQRKITKLEVWLDVLHKLHSLNTEGDFPRNLDEQVNFLKDRLKSQKKYTWRYNFDLDRYHTMEELKAVREQMPVQEIGYHQFYPKNTLQDYLKVKAMGNVELQEREKQFQKEKELEDMLYDEFMLKKLEKKSMFQLDEKEEIEDDKDNIFKQMAEGKLQDYSQDAEQEDLEELSGSSDEEDRFEEAAKRKDAQPKKKVLKRRKGRKEKDDFQIDEDD